MEGTAAAILALFVILPSFWGTLKSHLNTAGVYKVPYSPGGRGSLSSLLGKNITWEKRKQYHLPFHIKLVVLGRISSREEGKLRGGKFGEEFFFFK